MLSCRFTVQYGIVLNRELKQPNRSFFLLGPRQTGKSTWLKSLALPNYWTVNLLLNDTFFRYMRNPSQFRLEALEKIHIGVDWIIANEIQRIPEILNKVHELIESYNINFILSGSSARKLKRKGVNRHSGRALSRHMHPFTLKNLSKIMIKLIWIIY